MVFDTNLVLADNTADWTYANLVSQDYGTPVLTTRNDGGFAIVDLLTGTGAYGMAAVLIIDEEGAASTDAPIHDRPTADRNYPDHRKRAAQSADNSPPSPPAPPNSPS